MNAKGIPWRAVLWCFAWLLLLNASPENLLKPDPFETGDQPFYARKLREPFADQVKSASEPGHAANLNYRLTVPLLARALHLNLHGLRVSGVILALVSIPLLLRLFVEVTGDKITSLFWTLAILATPVTGRFFVEIHPYERFAMFFALVAAVARQPLVVFLSVLAVSWTDERAHLGCVWVVALQYLRLETSKHDAAEHRKSAYGLTAALLGCVAYWLTRWAVWHITGMSNSSGGLAVKMLIVHNANLPVGAFLSLETASFVLAGALAGMALAREHRAYAIFLGGMVVAGMLASATVVDFTRSLNFFWLALPVVIGFARWRMRDFWNHERLRAIGVTLALTCVLLPSTEMYLIGDPVSGSMLGGRYCLLDRYKPLPIRLLSSCFGRGEP